MKNKKIIDLIFIIFSCIVAIPSTLFVLAYFFSYSMLSQFVSTLFRTQTGSMEFFVIFVCFISSLILGIFSLFSSWKIKDEQLSYDKGKKYFYYIKILGIYNLVFAIIFFGLLFSAGLGAGGLS
jgi:hypothetical protein